MKKTTLSFLRKLLFVSLCYLVPACLYAVPLNTLDNLGLTSANYASVAYSLRLLSTSYSGPLVRITISSSTYDVWPDATGKFSVSSIISTANPGTTPGSKNGTTSLSSIISGSTSATVAIWYDQSGNLKNTSTASAPAIINAGTIYTSNGLPAIYFSSNSLTAISPVTLSNTNHTLFSVAAASNGTTISLNYATTTNNAGSCLGTGFHSTGAAWYGGYGQSGTYAVGTSNATLSILSKQYTSSTTTVKGYYNGVDTFTNTTTTYSLSSTGLMFGSQGNAGNQTSQKLSGYMSEVLVFISTLTSTVRQTVENNQMSYYFQNPNIRLQPSSALQRLCVGSTITPLVVTLYNTDNFTYQWYKNSTNSNVGGTLISGATNSTYTPDNSVGSSYYYYVEISNTKGTTVSNPSGLISISNAPVLSVSPGSTLVTGNPVTFTANPTNGGSSPLFQWKLNSTNVDNNNGSVLLNGTSQYLTMSPGVAPGTGAYTFDCWFYLNKSFSGVLLGTSGSSNQMTVYIMGQTSIGVDDYNYSNQVFSIPSLSLFTWTHIAVVRDATGNETVFINGVRSSTGAVSDTRNFSAASPRVGYGSNVGTYFSGNISNLRMVVGTNNYDPTLSSITVPTSAFTAITNTKLLLSANTASSLLTDGSAVQTITNNNTATWDALNMFPTYNYTNASLVAGDIISCTLTANTGCVSSATISDTMFVNPTIGVLAAINKTVGDASFSLTNPTSNSPGLFVYSSSNTSVATVSGNTINIIGAGSTIITALQAANGYFTSGNVTAILTVGTPAPTTWTGTVSTDWLLPGNWNQNVLPSGIVAAIIPSTTINQPTLTADVSIADITLNGTINLNGHAFTVSGSISGTGIFKGSSTSSLIVNSSSNNTLLFGTGATDTLLSNLTLNAAGKVTIGAGLGITSLLSLNNAATILDLNNNHLTLKSTSLANTAEVGTVVHGATIINGNVTVERYIPKEFRNYRDLGASVANAGSVFDNWQESGTAGNNVNYGFFITGPAAKGSPYLPGKIFETNSGLDYTTVGAFSMYTFNSNNWSAVTSTKGLSLNPYQGYRAIVRGARNFNMGTNPNTMPTATTVRATGKLVTGDVTISTSGTTVTDNSLYNSSFALTSGFSAYSLIANPYACPVQWSKIIGHSSIYNTYWYLDPTYQDVSGNQRYITVQYSGGSIIVTPNPKFSSGHNADPSFDYIQSGQAIMVNNFGNATPSVTFREADKAVGQIHNDVFGLTATSILSIELYKNNSLTDAAVANFNNNFTKAIGTEDASKMMNSAENISITESNSDLSIDGLPTPSVNDVLPVRLGQLVANTTYQLNVDISNFTASGLQAYVRDNMLNTEVAAGSMISFTPTSVDAQSYKDRFSVVFKQSKVVPVINVKGSINVFPNPVTAKSFKVQTTNIAAGKYNVVMVNSFGQEVSSTPITHVEGSNNETITMSKRLSTGIYTLVLKSAEGKTIYQTELLAK